MVNERNNPQEFADASEEKVATMLGSLKRVDAPGDFDFRVRARIAQGRPAEKRTWFPAFVRVAAPAMMLAAVGGYFGYNALYSSGNVGVPEVVSVQVEPMSDPIAEVTAQNSEAGDNNKMLVQPQENVIEDQMTFGKNTEVKSRAEIVLEGNRSKSSNSNKVTSFDIAQSQSNSIKIGNVENTVNSRPVAPQSVLDVFGSMGIRARYENGWRVSSASGRAASAGLKAGDIIEAINGKPVGANTSFDADFAGRTLRVKRDGTTIQISL